MNNVFHNIDVLLVLMVQNVTITFIFWEYFVDMTVFALGLSYMM